MPFFIRALRPDELFAPIWSRTKAQSSRSSTLSGGARFNRRRSSVSIPPSKSYGAASRPIGKTYGHPIDLQPVWVQRRGATLEICTRTLRPQLFAMVKPSPTACLEQEAMPVQTFSKRQLRPDKIRAGQFEHINHAERWVSG